MHIAVPEIVERDGEVFHQVDVRTADGHRQLWLSVPEQFGDMVSRSNDSSLVALLIPAMADGEAIRVEGPVSQQLLHHLTGPYQTLLRQVMPKLRRVTVDAPRATESREGGTGVATGFSGGIDSFSLLADYALRPVGPRLRLTHLLYHNVATEAAVGETLYRGKFARLAPTAARLGLPYLTIDSNIGEFYGNRLGFQQTHTPRNAAAALVLQRGLSRYYYASSYAYRDIFIGPTYDMAYCDPIGVPMLSTETLHTVSVGSEYRRIDKSLQVAQVQESWDSLDVCVWTRQPGNCSRCWKCLRTLLTFEIGGVLDRYARVFDLRHYRRARLRFMGEVLGSRNPLLREIIELARERGFRFPLAAYLFAPVPWNTIRAVRYHLRRARAKMTAPASVAAAANSGIVERKA